MNVIDVEPVSDGETEGKENDPNKLTKEEEAEWEKLQQLYPHITPTPLDKITDTDRMIVQMLEKNMENPDWRPWTDPNFMRLGADLDKDPESDPAKTQKLIDLVGQLKDRFENKILGPDGIGLEKWNELWEKLGDKKIEAYKEEMKDTGNIFERIDAYNAEIQRTTSDLDPQEARQFMRKMYHAAPMFFEELRQRGKTDADFEAFLDDVFPLKK